jgi:hypothetical protein
MIKQLLKSSFSYLGYEIRKRQYQEDNPLFHVYKYSRPDGSFDYEEYRRIQTEGNRRKIEWVWAVEENIAFLADYIRRIVRAPALGICHGTRRGKEQEWFRKYLGCEVIGTEISDTAKQFPHTIQWDFHETKPEWIDAVDFIYSNSFDHSYDPQRCLNAWMSCLKKGGLCILEHSSDNSPAITSSLDPFRADLIVMPYLITTWGQGRYCVRQLIEAPHRNKELETQRMKYTLDYLYFIVIQRL